MLLPWRKSLHLRIEPAGLRGTVRRGAWFSLGADRVLAQAEVPMPELAALGEALEVLFDLLEQRVRLSGVQVQVEFADAHATLDVIEGDFGDHTDRQLHDVASACLAELLGEASGQHELRCHLQQDERHLLSCALPRDSLSTLRAALQRRRAKLQQAQSRFCVLWNQQRRRLAQGSAVFAVARGPSAAIACVRSGVITALGRGAVADGGTAGAFDARVDRLLAGLGLDDEATRYLFMSDEVPYAALSSRWNVLPAGMPDTPRSVA